MTKNNINKTRISGLSNIPDGHSDNLGVQHSCTCGSDACKIDGGKESFGRRIFYIFGSILFFTFAILLKNNNPVISVGLFILSYLTSGFGYLVGALKSIIKGVLIDETTLMTIASLGAFALGEWAEGSAVMILFGIGQLLETYAVSKSNRSISRLLDLQPDTAHLIVDGGIITVNASEVSVGERVFVRPHERIPFDGIVIEGNGTVDNKMLTGESLPVDFTVGDKLLSGGINGNTAAVIQVSEDYSGSTASKIIEYAKKAAIRKSRRERYVSRFAKIYTPIVVMLAIVVAAVVPTLIGVFTGNYSYPDWVHLSLVFLIISCPCSLVISLPLTFFSGIGASSKKGILVKGADSLENLAAVDYIVFDKTGTLTKGNFEVLDIVPNTGIDSNSLLSFAAIAEKNSNHPIAKSIIRYVAEKGIEVPDCASASEQAGNGIIARYMESEIIVGKKGFFEAEGVKVPDSAANYSGSTVYVSKDKEYLGYLTIGDSLRPESKATIETLKNSGYSIMMLTGDSEISAKEKSSTLKIDHYLHSLLPHQKLSVVEKLIERGHKVAFVGDGVNDAPVITASDVGISMGAPGNDAAVESSDVVLISNRNDSLLTAIGISKRTMSIVRQNLVLALTTKLAIMFFGFFIFIPLWLALVADVGVMMMSVVNALRAMKAPVLKNG
ncbi:MAG: cadmium-translocating P-type ATPase [Ruminococcaceae bacterium]|nr:cadmium-translocating P-type ATPase [Oscillospiraceae bacterium]